MRNISVISMAKRVWEKKTQSVVVREKLAAKRRKVLGERARAKRQKILAEVARIRLSERLKKTPVFLKFRSYQHRAESKGLPFGLSEDEFRILVEQNCFYCGTPSGGGVDRTDSSLGYTSENSKPCCRTCNMMKWTLSMEDFLARVALIYKKHNL